MSHRVKEIVGVFLSDTLLIGYALFVLLILALILWTPDHAFGVGEDNLIVLAIEIAVCVFTVVWAFRRVVTNIRRAKPESCIDY